MLLTMEGFDYYSNFAAQFAGKWKTGIAGYRKAWHLPDLVCTLAALALVRAAHGRG